MATTKNINVLVKRGERWEVTRQREGVAGFVFLGQRSNHVPENRLIALTVLACDVGVHD